MSIRISMLTITRNEFIYGQVLMACTYSAGGQIHLARTR